MLPAPNAMPEKGPAGPAMIEGRHVSLSGITPLAHLDRPAIVPVPDREGWAEVTFEDFEEPDFPYDGWDVYNAGGPQAYWGRSSHRASSGQWSLYSVAEGSAAPPPGGNYPNNVRSWAVFGPVDLSEAGLAEVTFDYWSRTEANYDYFSWMASTNGTDFYGPSVSGNSGGWVEQTFDLANVPTIGDVAGEEQVWIAFVLESDWTIQDEGTYIDDFRLRAYMGIPPGEISLSTSSLTITEPGARMWHPTSEADRPAPEEYVPGRLVVRFAEGVTVDASRGTTSVEAINAVGRQFGLREARPLLAPAGTDRQRRAPRASTASSCSSSTAPPTRPRWPRSTSASRAWSTPSRTPSTTSTATRPARPRRTTRSSRASGA
jgi:hypothetical protein